MSFSAIYAGRAADVTHVLGQADNPSFAPHGGTLGELTRAYLAEVAKLVPADKSMIVKASGHSDENWTSVTLELATAQPVHAAPEQEREPAYAHPAEDAYTNPQ